MSLSQFIGYAIAVFVVIVAVFFGYRNRRKAQSSTVMEERPFPGTPKGLMLLLSCLFTLLVMWVIWHTLQHPLQCMFYVIALLISSAVFRFFYYHCRRCPECGSRLVLRREQTKDSKWRYRMMLDCSHCQIAWDTGDIHDDLAT